MNNALSQKDSPLQLQQTHPNSATSSPTSTMTNATSHTHYQMIAINAEIRDIVIGRMAALALDPSLYKKGNQSAFSNTVVIELFCAVLAANAVSNGPDAVNHLISDWILPTAVSLPPFCLTSVILHLALEASKTTAPLGSQDILQQVYHCYADYYLYQLPFPLLLV